jgi:hypothetical protein
MMDSVKVTTELTVDWKCLGHEFGMLSSSQQSDFFEGLRLALDGMGTLAAESQMMYIGQELSQEALSVLEFFLPAIWYKGGNDD